MARGYDIAVDGGGSRLRAFLVDDGEVVESLARPLGVNPNLVGLAETVAAIVDIVMDLSRPLARRGKKDLDQIDRIACGLAGVGAEMTRLAVHVGLRQQLGNHVSVHSDIDAFLCAARPSGPATVLIAGTGAIAMARGADQKVRRSGGLLPAGGDPGGGAWLARRAAEVLPELAEIPEIERPPALEDRAKAGNWAARGLFEEAAQCLADLLLELRDEALEASQPLVIHGGLIAGSTQLRSALRRRISGPEWGLQPARPRFDPRLGPLLLLRPATESSWPEPLEAPIL